MGGPQSLSGNCREEKNLWSLTEIEIRPSDVAGHLPTELSRLPFVSSIEIMSFPLRVHSRNHCATYWPTIYGHTLLVSTTVCYVADRRRE